MFDAKVLIKRLPSFSVPKITVIRQVKPVLKLQYNMADPSSLMKNRSYPKFARFRCKKGSLRVNSVMILVVLLTHAELASSTVWGRLYCKTGLFVT